MELYIALWFGTLFLLKVSFLKVKDNKCITYKLYLFIETI